MINFLLIMYFHGTESYHSIFLFLNSASNIQYTYIVYVPQYRTQGGTKTMRGCLETRSNLSILSNSMRSLANIILKNNYFENGLLKYHQKEGFAIRTKFIPPYSNLFMTGLEKRIFQNSWFKPFCGYDTLMRFLVYESIVFQS